jgi:hypothetical protein
MEKILLVPEGSTVQIAGHAIYFHGIEYYCASSASDRTGYSTIINLARNVRCVKAYCKMIFSLWLLRLLPRKLSKFVKNFNYFQIFNLIFASVSWELRGTKR